MQNTESWVTVILCSYVNIPTSQSTVHISNRKTTNVLACGQSTVILTFL